jgi:Asp-tRNA(Asn)/Glu-tRNA(Gln) amidotransferase A subunit family amidase
LAGIRPTIGLTSRDGIIPLYLERDVGGPMARTVEDVARTLDVLAGVDPADPATAAAAGKIPPTYTAALDRNALRGVRLGVLRRHSNRNNYDPEVLARFEEALRELERQGATIVDPFDFATMDSVRFTMCSSFKRDIEAYLAMLSENAPVKTLQQIVDSNRFHVTIGERLRGFLDDGNAGDPERCRQAVEGRARYQAGLRAEMQAQRLDAVIYPTWANPPRLIGDLTSPGGDNSQTPSPTAGFPAITVPMGWVRNGTLPVGLQFLGDAWTEARLIGFAYAYEQATHHRHPPASTPPLGARRP